MAGQRLAKGESKLTPELRARFLGYLRQGNFICVASKACGVSERAVYRLKAADPTFAAEVKEAIAASETTLIDIIRQAAVKSWQAAAWLLERGQSFERWRKKDKIDQTHTYQLDQLSDAQLQERYLQAVDKAKSLKEEGLHVRQEEAAAEAPAQAPH